MNCSAYVRLATYWLAATLSVASTSANDTDVDGRVLKLFGGVDGLSVLRNAEKVEAYRIKPQQFQDTGDTKTIAKYPVISGPHEVPAEQAILFKKRLQQARTYNFDIAKGCEFSPGIVLRYVGDRSTIMDVVFCFACGELKIYVGEQMIGGEDFDNVRAEFVAAMKKVFPDDQAIQKLN